MAKKADITIQDIPEILEGIEQWILEVRKLIEERSDALKKLIVGGRWVDPRPPKAMGVCIGWGKKPSTEPLKPEHLALALRGIEEWLQAVRTVLPRKPVGSPAWKGARLPKEPTADA